MRTVPSRLSAIAFALALACSPSVFAQAGPPGGTPPGGPPGGTPPGGPPDRGPPDGVPPGPPDSPPGLRGALPDRPDHAGGRGRPDTPPGLVRRASTPAGSRPSVLPGGIEARVCGADAPAITGPAGRAGRSHVAHTTFHPEDETDDRWGRLMYFWLGSELNLVFTGHELEPDSEQVLVALETDGAALCLAAGTVNPGGQLTLVEQFDPDQHIPADLDPFEEPADDGSVASAELLLLPADAVDCAAASFDEAATADGLVAADGLRFIDTDEVDCPD